MPGPGTRRAVASAIAAPFLTPDFLPYVVGLRKGYLSEYVPSQHVTVRC